MVERKPISNLGIEGRQLENAGRFAALDLPQELQTRLDTYPQGLTPGQMQALFRAVEVERAIKEGPKNRRDKNAMKRWFQDRRLGIGGRIARLKNHEAFAEVMQGTNEDERTKYELLFDEAKSIDDIVINTSLGTIVEAASNVDTEQVPIEERVQMGINRVRKLLENPSQIKKSEVQTVFLEEIKAAIHQEVLQRDPQAIERTVVSISTIDTPAVEDKHSEAMPDIQEQSSSISGTDEVDQSSLAIKIAEMYNKGHSIEEIVHETGLTEGAVNRHLIEVGIAQKQEKEDFVQTVERMRHEGYSDEEIARETKSKVSKIHRLVRLIETGRVQQQENLKFMDTVVRLRHEGYSDEEIANITNQKVSKVNSLVQRLVREGVLEKRPPRPRPQEVKHDQESTNDTTESGDHEGAPNKPTRVERKGEIERLYTQFALAHADAAKNVADYEPLIADITALYHDPENEVGDEYIHEHIRKALKRSFIYFPNEGPEALVARVYGYVERKVADKRKRGDVLSPDAERSFANLFGVQPHGGEESSWMLSEDVANALKQLSPLQRKLIQTIGMNGQALEEVLPDLAIEFELEPEVDAGVLQSLYEAGIAAVQRKLIQSKVKEKEQAPEGERSREPDEQEVEKNPVSEQGSDIVDIYTKGLAESERPADAGTETDHPELAKTNETNEQSLPDALRDIVSSYHKQVHEIESKKASGEIANGHEAIALRKQARQDAIAALREESSELSIREIARLLSVNYNTIYTDYTILFPREPKEPLPKKTSVSVENTFPKGMPKSLSIEPDLEDQVRDLLPQQGMRPSVIADILGLEREEVKEIIDWIQKKDRVGENTFQSATRAVEVEGIPVVGPIPVGPKVPEPRPRVHKGVVSAEEIQKAIEEQQESDKTGNGPAIVEEELDARTQKVVTRYKGKIKYFAELRRNGATYHRSLPQPETLARREAVNSLKKLPTAKIARILHIYESVVKADLDRLAQQAGKEATPSLQPPSEPRVVEPRLSQDMQHDIFTFTPDIDENQPRALPAPEGSIAAYILSARQRIAEEHSIPQENSSLEDNEPAVGQHAQGSIGEMESGINSRVSQRSQIQGKSK